MSEEGKQLRSFFVQNLQRNYQYPLQLPFLLFFETSDFGWLFEKSNLMRQCRYWEFLLCSFLQFNAYSSLLTDCDGDAGVGPHWIQEVYRAAGCLSIVPNGPLALPRGIVYFWFARACQGIWLTFRPLHYSQTATLTRATWTMSLLPSSTPCIQ